MLKTYTLRKEIYPEQLMLTQSCSDDYLSKSCLIDMFEAGGILSKEDVCDQMRKQWMIYQNEHNPQIVYVKE